jgi:hypothetical protein
VAAICVIASLGGVAGSIDVERIEQSRVVPYAEVLGQADQICWRHLLAGNGMPDGSTAR